MNKPKNVTTLPEDTMNNTLAEGTANNALQRYSWPSTLAEGRVNKA